MKTGGIRHGQGDRNEEIDLDIERFFRAVSRAIYEHHSKPSGLPLILAALPEYHAPPMSAVLLVAAWGVPLVLAAMLGIRAARGPAFVLAVGRS